MLKQFLLFAAGKQSYEGGWMNYKGDFDSAQEARCAGDRLRIKNDYQWMHVVDTETKELVLHWDAYAGGKWEKCCGV